MDNTLLKGRIRGRISSQVKKYLPYIRINEISFTSFADNEELDTNFLSVRIEYEIIPLSDIDNLELTLSVD